MKFPLNLFSLLGDRYSKLSYFANNDILSFYLGVRGLFSPQETAKILNTNIQEVNNFINKLSHQCPVDWADVNGGRQLEQLEHLEQLHPANLLSYLELKFYLQNQLLKDTDFMSMYHSIEVRVPFLDHLLVEYVSGLSPAIKLGGDVNKALLVEATHDLLPKEVFSRPKMGFTFPFEKWLSEADNNLITNNSITKTKSHWSRFWATVVLKNID